MTGFRQAPPVGWPRFWEGHHENFAITHTPGKFPQMVQQSRMAQTSETKRKTLETRLGSCPQTDNKRSGFSRKLKFAASIFLQMGSEFPTDTDMTMKFGPLI